MPVAKKATAAELCEAFVDKWNTREHWDSGGVRMGADLDAIMEAARAEAVAPLEARVAELESERGALVEADILLRARVGKVLNVLRQFVEAMPKCEWDEYECKEVATRHAYKQQFFCAAHQFASDVQPVEWAAPLRAALALLAADQSGEKAGKP